MLIKTVKRFVSSIVIIAVVLPSLAGCLQKKSDGDLPRYIDKNTPWYKCEKKVFTDSKAGNMENSFPVFADSSCKVFYKYIGGTSEEPSNQLIYINDQDIVTNIDISASFNDNEIFNLKTCFRKDNDLFAVIDVMKKNVNYNQVYRINIAESCLEYINGFNQAIETEYYVDKVICKANTYFVHFNYLDGINNKDAFCTFDMNFNLLNVLKTDDRVITWSVNNDSKIIAVEQDKTNIADTTVYSAVLDLDKCTAIKTNVEPEKYDDIGIGYITDDGYCYRINKELTLTKLNLETGEEKLVMDFNYSSVNMFDLQCSWLLYSDDETCVLRKNTVYPSESFNWCINTLKKESANPNAGKKILYVAPYFKIGSMAASAIKQMNEGSKDTFIYVTMDYSSLTFTDYETSDNSTISQYNKNTALVNKLKEDIRNGNGPDIVLDFARFSGLNDDAYLKDLLGTINDKSKFNREEYFDNVFDAYVKDDKLYQLPVSACIGGLYAYDTAVPDSKLGFTYSEYSDYVKAQCDGIDPFEHDYGRDDCFSILIKSSYDELYDEKQHINLNNDVFRNICNYVRDMNETAHDESVKVPLQFVEFNRIHFDLSTMLIEKDKRVYGMPSLDGSNGPLVFAYESVGVCSNTRSFDEAFGFIECLLSYDAQIQNVVYNPVNKAAFSEYANAALKYSNSQIKEMYRIADYNDPSIIDEYISYISSANTCYMSDDYSLLIMNEEIQAYFNHQKEIDKVIPIIENRVNNMAEEQK